MTLICSWLSSVLTLVTWLPYSDSFGKAILHRGREELEHSSNSLKSAALACTANSYENGPNQAPYWVPLGWETIPATIECVSCSTFRSEGHCGLLEDFRSRSWFNRSTTLQNKGASADIDNFGSHSKTRVQHRKGFSKVKNKTK